MNVIHPISQLFAQIELRTKHSNSCTILKVEIVIAIVIKACTTNAYKIMKFLTTIYSRFLFFEMRQVEKVCMALFLLSETRFCRSCEHFYHLIKLLMEV